MFFTLLITLYEESDNERIEEYLYCLEKNINNINIELIIIFFEYNKNKKKVYEKLKQYKIKIIRINKRPNFKLFIDYMNKYLKEKVCIIANSDIYFSEKNGLNLLKDVNFKNKIIALTRYNQYSQIQKYLKEYKKDKGIIKYEKEIKLKSFFHDGRSQDTWIIKAPINVDKSNFKLKIGINYCDLYLNNELLKLKKYKIYNPAKDLISIHHQKKWDYKKYKKSLLKGKLVRNRIYRKYMKQKGFKIKKIPFCGINSLLSGR